MLDSNRDHRRMSPMYDGEIQLNIRHVLFYAITNQVKLTKNTRYTLIYYIYAIEISTTR